MKKYNSAWFGSRAIAETVKEESWKFMMKAKPYEQDETAENLFLERLQEILQYHRSCVTKLTGNLIDGSEITEGMRSIRNKKIKERINHYINDRISDQKNWYITIGVYTPTTSTAYIAQGFSERIDYKMFKIDSHTGVVISMKMRPYPLANLNPPVTRR